MNSLIGGPVLALQQIGISFHWPQKYCKPLNCLVPARDMVRASSTSASERLHVSNSTYREQRYMLQYYDSRSGSNEFCHTTYLCPWLKVEGHYLTVRQYQLLNKALMYTAPTKATKRQWKRSYPACAWLQLHRLQDIQAVPSYDLEYYVQQARVLQQRKYKKKHTISQLTHLLK